MQSFALLRPLAWAPIPFDHGAPPCRSHSTSFEPSDPDVHAALIGEEQRQRDGLELIPSENYAFPEVYATNGSVFANKYAEGYPGRRYYGGQEFTDRIEIARGRAREALCSAPSTRTCNRSAVRR